jgi:predicted O-linked N-acetylglucosamine transferase (SPINDLY family)
LIETVNCAAHGQLAPMIARAVLRAAQSGVTLARRSHSKEIVMPNLAGEILDMDTTQPGSEEQLLEYAEHEEDLVRRSALEMLSDFDSEPVIARMAEALRDDSEEELVVVAALEWVGFNAMKQFYTEVVALLNDPAELVRDYAALALIEIGSEKDVALLEAKLAAAEEQDQPTLLYALASLGEAERYVERYLEFLGHEDTRTRTRAVANADDMAELVEPRRVTQRLEQALSVETNRGLASTIKARLQTIAKQADEDD